ncbi:MAG TPA: DUF692 domain-containing protein [Chromatiales bacterium]|nr:DUF692 domain-containing protein [Thiotrichales bacterium]HIP68758.1 DUF692 domain-containing protein [Chromatiales bacterium]
MMTTQVAKKPIPAQAGIGIRHVHFREMLERLPDIGWLEAHSENYFGDGGQPLYYLEQLRAHYPLSLHGVGMSVGSASPLDQTHLKKLKKLCDRFEPGLVSEHLCWGRVGEYHLNELLPLPYTEEALAHVVLRIDAVQEFIGRKILIENLSSYLEYKHSTIPEWEFLAETANRSGCGILLDVNNIYVNACNHDFDPHKYIEAIPPDTVGEIHLAGFEQRDGLLIDTHSRNVTDDVWDLYQFTLEIIGPRPSLIEWDADIPELDVLLQEASKAQSILQSEKNAAVA